jgi:putative NADH-flavin reductase
MNMTKVCIVGASGKLGQYMVQHALDRGYEVVAFVGCQTPSALAHAADIGKVRILLTIVSIILN